MWRSSPEASAFECPICFEVYSHSRVPAALPCGHACCLSCAPLERCFACKAPVDPALLRPCYALRDGAAHCAALLETLARLQDENEALRWSAQQQLDDEQMARKLHLDLNGEDAFAFDPPARLESSVSLIDTEDECSFNPFADMPERSATTLLVLEQTIASKTNSSVNPFDDVFCLYSSPPPSASQLDCASTTHNAIPLCSEPRAAAVAAGTGISPAKPSKPPRSAPQRQRSNEELLQLFPPPALSIWQPSSGAR